ncbi:MAG: hypothetical protein PHO89_11690 [Methylacidiphilaceae bacterium]|nr:hypothetical protein [Candidatus Methylacidiphilaceae bacterium]
MSVPIRSSDELLAALREHPEWRDAIRREIFTEELLELPARFQRAEAERKEEQKKAWEAIRGLTASQERTDATLKSFIESTERRFAEVEKRLDAIGIEVNRSSGDLLEIKVGRYLDRYLCEIMATSEPIENRLWSVAAHIAVDAGAITASQRREVGAADALAAGIDAQGREPACAVLEVSKTVHTHDVERADRRAKLLLQAMRAAVEAAPSLFRDLFPVPPAKSFAVVVGRTISEPARREAERKGVVFAQEAGGYDWEER